MEKLKLILDTDLGDDIDDALALALIAASPEFELLGVTTVFGNVDLRAKLACFLLSAFEMDRIPVFTGSGQPLVELRDLELGFAQAKILPDAYAPQYSAGAVEFISKQAEMFSGEVELVAIGPLTNVALALRSDPALASNLRGITLMGGQVGKPGPEWNILWDPEAAHIVFSSNVPIKMIGLDVTECCQLNDRELIALKKNKLVGRLVDLWQEVRGINPILHDPLAVAALLAPELMDWENSKILVELSGSYLRGQTIARDKGNVQVAKEVRRDAFIQLFLERIGTLG
jgi:purine nucleosidase